MSEDSHGSVSQRLYEHLCAAVRDGRAAHHNDTTSLVADEGYERVIKALLPLTEPIEAWLKDTYQHPTPFQQIEALMDFIRPHGESLNDDGLFEHCACCAHSRRSGCGGEQCPCQVAP